MTVEELQNLLVAPGTGILSRMIDRIQDLNNRVGATESDLPQRVCNSYFEAFQNSIMDELNNLKAAVKQAEESIAVLAAELEKPAEAKPKRSRAKKEAPEQAAAPEPQAALEPKPVVEPQSVPLEYAGVPLTANLVLSLRNDYRVLNSDKALILKLEPELSPELLDYVVGLTDAEVDEVVKREQAQ